MTNDKWNDICLIAHDYDTEEYVSPLSPLSAVHLLTNYYDEIMNGGFCKYFTNMEICGFREFPRIIEALKITDMKQYIPLTKKAIKLYKKCESNSKTADKAGTQIDELSDDFYKIEEVFQRKLYEYADKIID